MVYCTSDNQLLVMNFKLRLKKNLQQHRFIRLDLKAIPSEYSVELSNRFATIEVAKKLIPNTTKCKQKCRTSEAYNLIDERRVPKANGLDNSDMQETYQKYNREIQKALRHDKEQTVIKQCKETLQQWQIMCNMGFPQHLLKLLHILYQRQTATFRTGYGLTEWFSITQGVKQSCILSPFLFNISLNL